MPWQPVTRTRLSVLIVAALAAQVASALNWTTHGPLGGRVTQIAIAAASPRVVYAVTVTGLFRSDDAAETWRNVTGSLTNVAQVAVDPTNADVVYVTTSDGHVFKSTNGGASWADRSAGLQQGVLPSVLLVDAANPSTLYLGSHCPPIGFKTAAPDDYFSASGVYKSSDGGATWIQQNNGLSGRYFSVCVEELSLDPAVPQHLFTSPIYTDGGFSETYNGAASWLRGAGALPGRAIVDDPVYPLTRYGVTNIGGGTFLTSGDGGLTWSSRRTEVAYAYNDLAIDPATSRLFLATDKGIFRSGDGGVSWADSGAPAAQAYRVLADRNAGFVFAATSMGVFRMPLPLGPWSSFSTGGDFATARSIIGDPHDASNIYELTHDPFAPFIQPDRIVRTRDGGLSWQTLASDTFTSLAVDGDGNVYAPTLDALRRYSPSTNDWTDLDKAPGQVIVADPKRGGFLYSVNPYGYSRDGGRTWTTSQPFSSFVFTSVAVDPSRPTTLYARGNYDFAAHDYPILRSDDSGITWSIVSTSFTDGLLLVAPSKAGVLYRTDSGAAILRSDDGGTTWTPVPQGDAISGYFWAMTIDPRDDRSLWIVPNSGALYHTPDVGKTWQLETGVPGNVYHEVVAIGFASDGSSIHASVIDRGTFDASTAKAHQRPGGR